MPIPTGPRPSNRPNPQGDGELPETRLPIPPQAAKYAGGSTPTGGATPVSAQNVDTPPVEDDAFSSIPADEVSYDFDDDEEDLIPAPKPKRSRPVRKRTVEPEIDDEVEEVHTPSSVDTDTLDDYYGESTEDDSEDEISNKPSKSAPKNVTLAKDNGRKNRKEKKATKTQDAIKPGYTEDTFIDEETKTLKPFGRKQRNAKVDEFDRRKNMRNQQRAVQMIFVALALLAVALGLYRLLVPPKTLTQSDVMNIIATQTNDTGFPEQQGQAFAQAFMKAYLSNDATPIRQRVMAYFYSGTMDGNAPDGQILTETPSDNFVQNILYGPEVYATKPISANSSAYTIGALVEPASNQSKAPADGSAAKWAFFNVNVFYDTATGRFSIPSGSPTVVPAITPLAATDTPKAKSITTTQADDDLKNQVSSVIEGYVKGYASSSVTNHSAVDQYITDTSNVNLINGLNSQYSLGGNDDGTDPITMNVYPTDDPSTIKAEVTVNWVAKVNDQTFNTYKSTYVMNLDKQSNGKYLVSKFAPEYFVPDPASVSDNAQSSASSSPSS